MGDLASDMMKERRMEERAVEWAKDLITKVLKAANRPLDKYTIVDRIDAIPHEKVPTAWTWHGCRGRIDVVEKALKDLIGLKIVFAEWDDHTSIYSLVNPLDSLARNG